MSKVKTTRHHDGSLSLRVPGDQIDLLWNLLRAGREPVIQILRLKRFDEAELDNISCRTIDMMQAIGGKATCGNFMYLRNRSETKAERNPS